MLLAGDAASIGNSDVQTDTDLLFDPDLRAGPLHTVSCSRSCDRFCWGLFPATVQSAISATHLKNGGTRDQLLDLVAADENYTSTMARGNLFRHQRDIDVYYYVWGVAGIYSLLDADVGLDVTSEDLVRDWLRRYAEPFLPVNRQPGALDFPGPRLRVPDGLRLNIPLTLAQAADDPCNTRTDHEIANSF